MNENKNEENLIDLTQYLDRFYRSLQKIYRWLLLIPVVCAALCILYTWFNFTTTYTSKMTVIVAAQNQSLLETSDSSEGVTAAFQKALVSEMMVNIICNDLNVNTLPSAINITRVPDTNLMIISSTANNEQDAYDVLNSVVTNYGQLTKLMDSEASMVIVEEPELPTSPDSTPQYIKQAFVGLLSGLSIDLMILCLYTFTRKTILKESDIKHGLRLNSLGSIPAIAKKRANYRIVNNCLVTNNRLPGYFKESFNILRISIEKEKEDNNHQVFMFTSALPNEGKSTICANTALVLANTGKKVLLIDLDLRNPSVADILKINDTSSEVGNFLSGKAYLKDVLKKHPDIPNLHLILGSNSFSNSVELLSQEGLDKIINKFKEYYEYILIDVPPLDTMQDAVIIGRLCDASILVIRQDYASQQEIFDGLEELQGSCNNIIGAVLNLTKSSIFDNETHTYGYNYGYGYGYGRKNN